MYQGTLVCRYLFPGRGWGRVERVVMGVCMVSKRRGGVVVYICYGG